jgi:hypothetical protein
MARERAERAALQRAARARDARRFGTGPAE